MNWTNIIKISDADSDLFELELVKAHLNVSHDDDDELIEAYIAAALATVEGPSGIGVPLLTATYRASFDGFPCDGLTIPLTPVQEITSITYTDPDGGAQTLDANAIAYDLDAGKVVIKSLTSFPATQDRPGAVKVTFEAGYGDTATEVPADLRAAILLTIGHLYANREAVSTTQTYTLPMAVDSILERYRVLSFG